jgi:hypothetical protein
LIFSISPFVPASLSVLICCDTTVSHKKVRSPNETVDPYTRLNREDAHNEYVDWIKTAGL